jgi:hypothetical protein
VDYRQKQKGTLFIPLQQGYFSRGSEALEKQVKNS